MRIAQRCVGLAPTWQHDFRSGALPAGATFTRATTATYFNSSGVLSSASSGTARFDYDPVTLSPLGYLAEMASTNACAQSSNFAGAGWTANNVAAATDGTLGPDGSTEMYKITSSAGAANHYHEYTSGTSITAGQAYSVSVIIKQGTERYCTVGDGGASSWHSVSFDFNTGTIGATTNASGTARQLANGLWRISCNISSSSSTHNARVFASFGPNDSTNVQNYNAAGTETGYASCAQIDSVGVGCTSYIPTAGATVTRNQDVLSLPLSSLPGWDANQGGVLVAAYRLHTHNPSSPGYGQHAATISDGTANNGVFLWPREASSGLARVYFTSGGVDQAYVSLGAASAVFTRRKQAMGWGSSRGAGAVDGGAAAGASGSLSLPVGPTTLDLGRYTDRCLNGTLESIAYYKGQKADAVITGLSA